MLISDSLTLASNIAITFQRALLASKSSEANGKVLNKPSKKAKSARRNSKCQMKH